jgi:F-type H+-transporting ATPase subunit delta
MASVAIRYARAFADVVLDLKLDVNKVRGELRSLVEIMHDSPDLAHVWENPAVTHEEKLRVLDAVVARAGFDRAVRDFTAVLIEHGRSRMLAPIVRQYEIEMNRRLGFVEAEVQSARELSRDEKSAMEAQIAALTGCKVLARYRTEAGILGGATVRIGSTIYDGSVRGQLQRIKEQLSAE